MIGKPPTRVLPNKPSSPGSRPHTATLSSPRSIPSSSRPRHLEASPRAQRSLSPSSVAASPTNRRPSYGSNLLAVPGRAPGDVDADFGLGLSPTAASPDTASRHRRGSRSSILASATEATGATGATSDRESIRSSASSSRAAPSSTRRTSKSNRPDDRDRNASPVSFYSTLEAPFASPCTSRQGSLQVENTLAPFTTTSPPTAHAQAQPHRSPRTSIANASNPSHRTAPTPPAASSSTRAASDRITADKRPVPSTTTLQRAISAQHDRPPSGAVPNALTPSLSAYSWQSDKPDTPAKHHAYPQAQSLQQPRSAASEYTAPKSISTSRSASTFAQLESSSARPRSKSSASSSKDVGARSQAAKAAAAPSVPLPTTLTATTTSNAPSKLSLRSRIFGLKSSQNAPRSSSPADSGTDTPSPRSAHFPPSVHSEGSHSDSAPLDRADSLSIDRDFPSPSYSHSALGHSRDADDEMGDAFSADPRSTAQAGRKSSGATSFLRKTIRFKDKSAFLKPRPSISSLNSDSAASASQSVPPSPADPPSSSDAEDAARKAPSYKQVSGRRGAQYHEPAPDLNSPANLPHSAQHQPSSLDAKHQHRPAALLPAVTERDLQLPPEARRQPYFNAQRRLPSRSESSSALMHDRSSGSNAQSIVPSPTAIVASSPVTTDDRVAAQNRIPRSSSLHAPTGRDHPDDLLPYRIAADRSVSSSLATQETPASPRRRPRSGSANAFAPQIQPRTTSSPAQSQTRRPVTAQGTPEVSQSPQMSAHSPARSSQRTTRPKTADSGHGYSNSLSSLRDILVVANAISEEGAYYNSPDKSAPSPSAKAAAGASPVDSKRPGLPPKNPLRKQRPSAASAADTPSVSGDSPASAHTSGVFPGPAMLTTQTSLSPTGVRPRDSIGPLSATSSSPTDFRTPTSEPTPLPSLDRHSANDYFRPRDASRPPDAPLMQIPARSPSAVSPGISGTSSPAYSTLPASQQLSRAPSTDSALGYVSRRHERAASDAASSITDLRTRSGPGASTPSLHSESSSSVRKKKDGPGSKMFAFARDLAQREGSETNATLSSSGTFRLGRSSKSKKGDVSNRLVIRRLYDGPLEAEAAAHASRQASGSSVTSPVAYAEGVSPGSSVADLANGGAHEPHTPGGFSTPGYATRLPSSGSLVRSASSSGSTARDYMLQGSNQLLTPQFMNTNGTALLARSPSFVKPSWSIPQDGLSPTQKRLSKRWFILRELLDTEKAYASDLAVARDIYLARAKLGAGITTPLSPLSVRSASVFSQLASPEPPSHGRSSQPHLHHRGSVNPLSPGAPGPAARGPLPQRTLFRHASADASATAALASPHSVNQAPSSTSLASSNPSNRSSVYTVSSQSSQTSDASHFALAGHSNFGAGLPSQFSIDGGAPSPSIGLKLSQGSPLATPSPGFSPAPSTPATPSIMTPSSFPGLGDQPQSNSSDAPFSPSDVRIIFAQLEACAAFADEMVAVLESAVGTICTGPAEDAAQLLARGDVTEDSETDRVGQAFLKIMPRIEQVYSAYCSRHEASMARLQELLTTRPKTVAFVSECTQAARAYTNAWDLSSLLIKPVQRVLKYPLLLAQILESTGNQHPDAENLAAASAEIQKVADNINEVKKRKDLVEQIVSGKTARRTTSQRMQHGATKKLLRRQEKVKKAVLGPTEDLLADDGQYKSLVVQFRTLEKSVASFARRCSGWSTSVKEAHLAQLRLLDQWCRTYAVDETLAGSEAEMRLRAFMDLIEQSFLSDYWTQLDSEIRTSLTPAVQRMAALFILPQAVIAKRNDREADYSRYRAEITRSGSKAVDKKLTDSANAFVALHTQLMNELPQFNYGIQTLMDICIESLSRTQASYHLRVHRALISFWQSFGPEGAGDIVHNEDTDEKSMRHLNPVKIFWPLHSNIAGFAESLSIVSGVYDRSRSASVSMDSELLAVGHLSPSSNTHFSPLQSERALPDPEFSSKVPDASSMSQQIESITAAGSEELLEPMSARASPFATPPLGSRGPSFSPQLHQQALLGSPAPIGSASLHGAQSGSGAPPLRTTKSGGLIGLLRSVGSSSAMGGTIGSRKNSQSTDTMAESFGEGSESKPPTPISKDTPVLNKHEHDDAAEDVAPPTLPALSFNSGFFAQSEVFSTHPHGPDSLRVDPSANQAVDRNPALPATSRAKEATSSSTATPAGTMAAVANSPAGTRASKAGHPLLEYVVGDLFRVVDGDASHLFGSSEHGATGWVERENFVPLS
ncbi:invasion-inducing protein TIAM1/CDC24 [Moesziomyces antarcticus T-34]|uniref:Invasion-inducing protein TIAM1/CDC24 n=1 Tax=Pseudozyma antarctica (strain T-34) TaxID=1151754 RepID=M9MFP1_PSEA3|nr:invasion-inducing protein TIAM1/CDC24 [Moesziomyces antarcticus T-34]